MLQKETELFRMLADPTRLRLAVMLAAQGETCVCDLACALQEPDFKISRHLGILRAHGLVVARREATWMHYRLNDPRNELEAKVYECLRSCLTHQTEVVDDLARFKRSVCEQKKSCGCRK